MADQPKMEPIITKSNTSRPYTITVDGDIPDGAKVLVHVTGYINNNKWEKTYTNPVDETLVSPQFDSISFKLIPCPNSIATPFLYSVYVQGDYKKWEYGADLIANNQECSREWVLITPENDRPYLAYPIFAGAKITRSNINQPWMFVIDGDSPRDAELEVIMINEGDDPWQMKFKAPCRIPLPPRNYNDKPRFIISTMKATSDGIQSPSIEGVAIEGDYRSHYFSVATILGDDIPESLWLITLDNDRSLLMLKPIFPKFNEPPTALTRLMDLHERGELEVEGLNDE